MTKPIENHNQETYLGFSVAKSTSRTALGQAC